MRAVGRSAQADTYEKPSCRANLATTADCARCCPAARCFRAPPFSQRKGQPPYVEAYDAAGQKKLLAG